MKDSEGRQYIDPSCPSTSDMMMFKKSCKKCGLPFWIGESEKQQKLCPFCLTIDNRKVSKGKIKNEP